MGTHTDCLRSRVPRATADAGGPAPVNPYPPAAEHDTEPDAAPPTGSALVVWMSLTAWAGAAVLWTALAVAALLVLRETALALLGDNRVWNLTGTGRSMVDPRLVRAAFAALAFLTTLAPLVGLAATARLAVESPEISLTQRVLQVWSQRRVLLTLLAVALVPAATAALVAFAVITLLPPGVVATVLLVVAGLTLGGVGARLLLGAAHAVASGPMPVRQRLVRALRHRPPVRQWLGATLVVIVWTSIPVEAAVEPWSEWSDWISRFSTLATALLALAAASTLAAQLMAIAGASLSSGDDAPASPSPSGRFATASMASDDPLLRAAVRDFGRARPRGGVVGLLVVAFPLLALAGGLLTAFWLWFSPGDYDEQWWQQQQADCDPWRAANPHLHRDNPFGQYMSEREYDWLEVQNGVTEDVGDGGRYPDVGGWFPFRAPALVTVVRGRVCRIDLHRIAPSGYGIDEFRAAERVFDQSHGVVNRPAEFRAWLEFHQQMSNALSRARPLCFVDPHRRARPVLQEELGRALADHLAYGRGEGWLTVDHLQGLDRLLAKANERSPAVESGMQVEWLDYWQHWQREERDYVSARGTAEPERTRGSGLLAMRNRALMQRAFGVAQQACERARREATLSDSEWFRLHQADPDRYLPPVDGLQGMRTRGADDCFRHVGPSLAFLREQRVWRRLLRYTVRADAWRLRHGEWPTRVEQLESLPGFPRLSAADPCSPTGQPLRLVPLVTGTVAVVSRGRDGRWADANGVGVPGLSDPDPAVYGVARPIHFQRLRAIISGAPLRPRPVARAVRLSD